MRFRLSAVVILLALSAGCGGSGGASGDGDKPDEESSPAAVTPSVAPSSATNPCALLEPTMIEELAGEQLVGQEATVPGSELRSCAYGRLDQVGVQVIQVPSSEWARALPGIVDQLKAMGALGDPDILRGLNEAKELIERGETVAPKKACSLFSDMLEFRDGTAGLDRSIAYIPNQEDPQAMSVQACIDGTYTSIVVGRPDLQVSQDEGKALGRALAAVT